MNFSMALYQVKTVKCAIKRTSWNNEKLVKLIDANKKIDTSFNSINDQNKLSFDFDAPILLEDNQFSKVLVKQHFVIRFKDETEIVGWIPTIEDLMADDWEMM